LSENEKMAEVGQNYEGTRGGPTRGRNLKRQEGTKPKKKLSVDGGQERPRARKGEHEKASAEYWGYLVRNASRTLKEGRIN